MFNDTSAIIIELMRKILPSLPPVISVTAELRSLGINSMSFVRVIVEIENKFSFEFRDNEINYCQLSTIERLSDLVNEKRCWTKEEQE